VTGTSNAFFAIRGWNVALGREFEDSELNSAAGVCVIGETVRRELFGASDPVGQTFRVGKLPCRIVGVLESKQATMGADQDDIVVTPLRTFQRRITGNKDVSVLYVSTVDANDTDRVKRELELLMRERRRILPGTADDFSVRDMREILETVQQTTGVLTALLGAIAAVSLLVGGIGIMNIMLVSVTERTREIGIRLAIGARSHEVLLQFLVEAAVLSTLGGIVGIGVGLGGAKLAADQLGMPFGLVPGIIAVAFVFSTVVGVGFGYLPARKAARLDPIEALRHE
jgi:putative ABC transport system permease protein